MRTAAMTSAILAILTACREPMEPQQGRQPGILASYVPADAITITSLGRIADETNRLWINDQGQVLSEYVAVAQYCDGLAHLWQAGSWTDVATPICSSPPLPAEIRPIDLNNLGQVLGSEESFPTFEVRYFIWEAGTVTYLNLPSSSFPEDLNDIGQIAGVFFPRGVGDPPSPTDTAHVFIWENGTFTDLGTNVFSWDNANFSDLGYRSVAISQMNNAEQVIGLRVTFDRQVPQRSTLQSFFWDIPKSRFVLLPEGASALNDSGVVLTPNGKLWDSVKGVYTTLPLSPGRALRGVDNLGQVAGLQLCGQSLCSPETPAVWQDGNLRTLPTLTENGQPGDCEPLSINNVGQIAGICPNTFFPVIWSTLEPASAAEEGAHLITAVNDLMAAGVLGTPGKSLKKKLQEALNDLAAGDTTGAIKAFHQFISQVWSLYDPDGVLTLEQAQALVDDAQHAIEQLSP